MESTMIPEATPSPRVEQLVRSSGACWIDADSLDAWIDAPGDRVLFFSGDPVRFPEGLDVAVVLPQLQAVFAGRFTVGVVRRDGEEAIARRFGSQRWPALVFLRDGHYVTTLHGMHDWDVFVQRVAEALALPASRAPGIGVPLVAAQGAAPGCH
jgi:hydrogenase-1 operon protein HyaE